MLTLTHYWLATCALKNSTLCPGNCLCWVSYSSVWVLLLRRRTLERFCFGSPPEAPRRSRQPVISDCTEKNVLQWSITRANQEVLAQTISFWHLRAICVQSDMLENRQNLTPRSNPKILSVLYHKTTENPIWALHTLIAQLFTWWLTACVGEGWYCQRIHKKTKLTGCIAGHSAFGFSTFSQSFLSFRGWWCVFPHQLRAARPSSAVPPQLPLLCLPVWSWSPFSIPHSGEQTSRLRSSKL